MDMEYAQMEYNTFMVYFLRISSSLGHFLLAPVGNWRQLDSAMLGCMRCCSSSWTKPLCPVSNPPGKNPDPRDFTEVDLNSYLTLLNTIFKCYSGRNNLRENMSLRTLLGGRDQDHLRIWVASHFYGNQLLTGLQRMSQERRNKLDSIEITKRTESKQTRANNVINQQKTLNWLPKWHVDRTR